VSEIIISSISNIIIPMTPQVFADGTTRGTYFSRLIPTRPASKAGGSQWKFKASGSTASARAELDPMPAATKFTQLDPQLNGAYFATTLEISDEAMNALEANPTQIPSYLDQQVEDAIVALRSQIETATVAGLNATNGFVGLDLWVSDTGSPAGIDRTTYSNWQAYYNDNSAVARPLTMTLMRDVADTLVGTRQGSFNCVAMAPSKATTFSGLSGAGQVQRVFNVNNGDMGGLPPVGVGAAADVLRPFGYFDEAPCYRVPTMPSDVIWLLDLNEIHYEEVQPVRVSAPRRSERGSTVWDITVGLTLVVPNPYKNCAAVADLS
jgi:hypothetical protein